jgi:hypothetical protein
MFDFANFSSKVAQQCVQADLVVGRAKKQSPSESILRFVVHPPTKPLTQAVGRLVNTNSYLPISRQWQSRIRAEKLKEVKGGFYGEKVLHHCYSLYS